MKMSGMDMSGMDMPGMDMSSHKQEMLMPGMLSPEEMQRLAAAKGAEFDKLFLRGMIKHHEGALTMVADCLAVGLPEWYFTSETRSPTTTIRKPTSALNSVLIWSRSRRIAIRATAIMTS